MGQAMVIIVAGAAIIETAQGYQEVFVTAVVIDGEGSFSKSYYINSKNLGVHSYVSPSYTGVMLKERLMVLDALRAWGKL